MNQNRIKTGVVCGMMCAISGLALGQTTEVSPHVFRVESGVNFDIANSGLSSFLFSWSDSSGTVTNEEDPTLILTAGETYMFRRVSGSHPFVITDTSLPTSGTDGSYQRDTFNGAVIDAATLDPIADFTANPAPTADFIEWTPSVADIGDLFYTCRVISHFGMTGRIEVVAGVDTRDVQIRSVDFDNGIVEFFNYGTADQDMTGWRTCTHDFDQVRRYSGASGLNGVIIEAGTSVFVHYNNDAPADPDHLDRSTIGGNFALPLDQDAYAMQLFFPATNGNVSFGNSSLIADHLQWNINGNGVGSAEFRTNQAVSEGLWTAIGDFIGTTADSSSLALTDLGDGRLHGPNNYTVTNPNPCPADLSGEGDLNFLDVSAFLTAYGNMDPIADFEPDGNFNFLDVSAFLTAYGQGCP